MAAKAKTKTKPVRAAKSAKPAAPKAAAPSAAPTRPAAVASEPAVVDRTTRRSVKGIVISDKMQKTIVVQVERMYLHQQFGKYLKDTVICKAHDEKNEAHIGDLVEISETRPLSATKRWRLLRIERRAGQHTDVEGALQKS